MVRGYIHATILASCADPLNGERSARERLKCKMSFIIKRNEP